VLQPSPANAIKLAFRLDFLPIFISLYARHGAAQSPANPESAAAIN
jgi:hypothetical protein